MEKVFPEPRLIPVGHEKEVAALLKHEDDLHLDLRTLSFRFVFNPPGPPKTPEQLKKYRTNGTGTLKGIDLGVAYHRFAGQRERRALVFGH
jgi:hypothetical protein